jgi:Protein of unknown function (Gmx_para_CXXCG)
MKFWRLTHPEYESGDYSHTYINGSLEHPFGLPGVNCDVCGGTWGGSRYLPLLCPKSLRRLNNIREGWAIARTEHTVLQRRVMRELHIRGKPFAALRPGDVFQPSFLDVPSHPRADFLWASIGTLVVSERIKRLLVSACSKDVAACPVTLRKVGRRSPRLEPIEPESGEPEDMLKELPTYRRPTGVGKYFEIIIKNESGYPRGGTPKRICAGCQRPTIGENRKFRMTPKMWKGNNIFYMATTLYIIATDDLRQRVERLRPTNVCFERI